MSLCNVLNGYSFGVNNYLWHSILWVKLSVKPILRSLSSNIQGITFCLKKILIYSFAEESHLATIIYWYGNVVRMTALVVTGDVDGKLQRLHWWSGQSSWWHFLFCGDLQWFGQWFVSFRQGWVNSLRPSDAYVSVNLPSLVQIMACRLVVQWWHIVNFTWRNTFQWNIWNSKVCIQVNAYENIVWEMAAILCQSQCVNFLAMGVSYFR